MNEIRIPYRVSFIQFIRGAIPQFGIQMLGLVSIPAFLGVFYWGYRQTQDNVILFVLCIYSIVPVVILVNLMLKFISWKFDVSPFKDCTYIVNKHGIIIQDGVISEFIPWKDVTGYRENNESLSLITEYYPSIVLSFKTLQMKSQYGVLRRLLKQNKISVDEFDEP